MDEKRCNVRYLNMQLGLPAIIVNLVTFLHANIQTQGTLFSRIIKSHISYSKTIIEKYNCCSLYSSSVLWEIPWYCRAVVSSIMSPINIIHSMIAELYGYHSTWRWIMSSYFSVSRIMRCIVHSAAMYIALFRIALCRIDATTQH